MADIKWVGSHIEVTPPKRPKKITGTRFAAIFGLNRWNSEFKTWAEITRVYQEPFEDTKFTLAGKAIEPKQAEFMKKSYAMFGLRTPTDEFGEDYFSKTYGDFFPKNKHFGGMWDYLDTDDDGKVTTVLEMKTTQRSEDWEKDIPEYYAIQAALYAYLLGVDDVIMVASFLEPKDYDHPENYKVSVENTITVPFKVSERYPNFPQMIADAEKWWKDHVDTGISPDFDEKADADILKELRKNSLNPDTDVAKLIEEGEALQAELDEAGKTIEKQKKRLEAIKKQVKEHLQSQFRDGDTKTEIKGTGYVWCLSRSTSTKLDEDRLKADGLYEKYSTTEPSYRMTVSKIKEEK